MKRAIGLVLTLSLLVAGGSAAHAARSGGKGKGGGNLTAPTCWADPGTVALGDGYVLNLTGLPTDQALNVWVTDTNGTYGWPFGMSVTGTEAWNERADVAGTKTYTVTGEERHTMKVYATCSVEIV